MMRSVVVTGVSSGIGFAAAQELIKRGFKVFGSVRRAADGVDVKARLGAGFEPLLFDVTDSAAVQAAADHVRAALGGATLAGLVNNAGIAVAGPLLHLALDEFRQQIDVNLTGQLCVTQAFAPLLGADRSLKGAPGRIVMISSVSGVNGSPFLGAYAASKFGLEGLSESLRRELMLFGIDVIVIGPGAVQTPIWAKAEQIDVSRYANTAYGSALTMVRDYMVANGRKGLPVERLGTLIADALTLGGRKVRYAIVPERLQSLMMRALPKRMVDRLIAKRLGLVPRV